MHQNAVNILADAESELVRQEVKDKGGVVRGSTAAKVQVSSTEHVMHNHTMPIPTLANCRA